MKDSEEILATTTEEKEYMRNHDLVVHGPMELRDFINAVINFKSVTVLDVVLDAKLA